MRARDFGLSTYMAHGPPPRQNNYQIETFLAKTSENPGCNKQA